MTMVNRRKSFWMWLLAVVAIVGLFGPAALMATSGSSGSDDFDLSEFETLQKCYGTSQSDS